MDVIERRLTRKDYDRLPEGYPVQLIDGMFLREAAPTYGHNYVAATIRFQLLQLLGPARVPDTPASVLIDEFNVYQPDIVVLSAPADVKSSYVGTPLLAVEVLSPSTRRRDRSLKVGRLIGLGVKEIWLADPATKRVEVCTHDGRRVFRRAETAASKAVPGFALVPNALFADPA